MSELTLYGDASWQSPWVFHVMVALDELGLRTRSIRPSHRDDIKAVLARTRLSQDAVPRPRRVLADRVVGDLGVPRRDVRATAAPADHAEQRDERARARQVMSWLRTSLFGLREDRPTSSVFMRPVTTPLVEKARADGELLRVADKLPAGDRKTLLDEWSIADVDLALMLMRLVANDDLASRTESPSTRSRQWGRLRCRSVSRRTFRRRRKIVRSPPARR